MKGKKEISQRDKLIKRIEGQSTGGGESKGWALDRECKEYNRCHQVLYLKSEKCEKTRGISAHDSKNEMGISKQISFPSQMKDHGALVSGFKVHEWPVLSPIG